jgi:sulfide:quinone oxidoreductase
MRVVVLGAGFGGLELASALSARLAGRVEVTLVDRAEGFVFGFSKLDVMFGRATPQHVTHPYSDLAHPGVAFVRSEVRAIDPVARRVSTDAGELEADLLVVALGADLDAAATPGLLEGGVEFYTPEGAFAARDVLDGFDGGRVVVAVTSTPFKCPPAPSETALLVHDLLRRRGLLGRSSVSLVMPLPSPIPPSPDASAHLLATFENRGIGFQPGRLVRRLDADRGFAVDTDGDVIGYDLFLGVPKHVAPPVVVEAGLTVDGWIPVDPATLRTRFPGVYAVGDVTSVGTPKAGVFAEGQAAVVAGAIVAQVEGTTGESPTYDGVGVCYFEVGGDEVAKVQVTFVPGRAPFGHLEAPSDALAAEKAEFGTDRIRRWFGREWAAY